MNGIFVLIAADENWLIIYATVNPIYFFMSCIPFIIKQTLSSCNFKTTVKHSSNNIFILQFTVDFLIAIVIQLHFFTDHWYI